MGFHYDEQSRTVFVDGVAVCVNGENTPDGASRVRIARFELGKKILASKQEILLAELACVYAREESASALDAARKKLERLVFATYVLERSLRSLESILDSMTGGKERDDARLLSQAKEDGMELAGAETGASN